MHRDLIHSTRQSISSFAPAHTRRTPLGSVASATRSLSAGSFLSPVLYFFGDTINMRREQKAYDMCNAIFFCNNKMTRATQKMWQR